MVHSASKRVQFRRRRQGLTDYRRRLALLKSHQPRVVVRCSNAQTTIQFVNFAQPGDKVITGAISKQLRRHGWEAGLSNLPAAYLTGLLAGKEALKAGVEGGVLDLGLAMAHVPGSKVYAALKGLVDAGLEIPHSPKILPPPERLEGQHMTESDSIKTQVDKVKTALEKM